MFKPAIYFNDYVSLAVMLLMIVALVSGQATANGAQTEDFPTMAPIVRRPSITSQPPVTRTSAMPKRGMASMAGAYFA